MKKLISILLALVMLMSLSVSALAVEVWDTNPMTAEEAEAAGYAVNAGAVYEGPSSGSLSLPSSVDGERVYEIDDDAFRGYVNITSVIIPPSITQIGSSAFYNCTSLAAVTIPDSVTIIASSAFSGCDALTTIYYSGTATGAPWGAENASIVSAPAAGYETPVSYAGTGSESYSITVPAALTPGGSGTVSVTGTWASNRRLTITAPASLTMTNSLDLGAKSLAVSFAGINQVGNNTNSISASVPVSVAEITNALFGTWNGTIVYTVSMGAA